MSRKIMETKQYHRFVLAPFNRPVESTRKLEDSMRRDGFWDDEPILVRRENGRFIILRGQHRFFIAQKLGLPIKYLVTTRTVNIAAEERTKRPWTLKDYLFSYCQMRKEAYLRVKEYHEETGIRLSSCISMMAGDSAGSGNLKDKFKDGTYRLGNLSHSRVVASIIKQAQNSGFPYWSNNLFVQAVSKIAWAEGFASEVMKEKIKTFVHFMERQASKQGYVEMLESIYNRQSREKIPLTFLAEQAAKKRSAIKSQNYMV